MKGKQGQKSYEATAEGIVIKDKRQMTNGPITPNYVIDLYLPVIGFAGLGLLTTLYRVAIDEARAIAELTALARAGRVGFRTVDGLLALLDRLQIINVRKPEGELRGKHYKTEIELLDPPARLPLEFADTVLDRTLTGWMIDRPSCQATIGELLGNNSPIVAQQLANSQATIGELLPDNSMNKEDVPTCGVPTCDVPTHTAREAPGVCGSRHTEAQLMAYALDPQTGRGIKNPKGWVAARLKDGKADAWVDQRLEFIEQQKRAREVREERERHEGILPPQSALDPELLERFLKSVEGKVNSNSFRTWFECIDGLYRANGSVALRVPDEIHRDWITTNYFDVIEEAMTDLGLGGCKVSFVVEDRPLTNTNRKE